MSAPRSDLRPTLPPGSRTERAWAVLHSVADPEIPVVSVCDLGIAREVQDHGDRLTVVLTPTYSGCPATEVIEASVRDALEQAGLGPVTVHTRRAPAWSTDWISEDGRRKLREYGIAPPAHIAADPAQVQAQPIRLVRRTPAAPLACPHCGSTHTEQLSAFGSTACKALHRCLDCREPFEHFKPI